MELPKCYAVRFRVECNDEHANPQALEKLHGDVNGLMVELLKHMAGDAKLKQQTLYEFTGGVQKRANIANLAFDSPRKPEVTYT